MTRKFYKIMISKNSAGDRKCLASLKTILTGKLKQTCYLSERKDLLEITTVGNMKTDRSFCLLNRIKRPYIKSSQSIKNPLFIKIADTIGYLPIYTSK